MQLNTILIAAAALFVSASPALASVNYVFYEGASCTGTVGTTYTGAKSGDCIYITNQGSYRSIAYSGVPSGSHVSFYKSGGPNDKCNGTPSVTLGSGSGCATAPDGYNLESVKWQ